MRVLVTILGTLPVAVGVRGIGAPECLLEFGRSLQDTFSLYLVGALRTGFGLILLAASGGARTPRAFRAFGALLIVLGVLTPAAGRATSQALFRWWSVHGLASLRVGAAATAAFGIYLIAAVVPRRA